MNQQESPKIEQSRSNATRSFTASCIRGSKTASNDFGKTQNWSGFTLIELMVVAVLISLVAMVVFSAFKQGFTLWTKSQYTSHQERAIIFLERFARELNNTFEFPPIGFEGEEEKFSFPSMVVKYDWDWSNKEGKSKDDPDFNITSVALPLLVKLTYEYDEEENSLLRKEEVYAYPDLDGLKMNPDGLEKETSRTILTDIDKITFSYSITKTAELSFDDSFKAEPKATVPYAVKIELALKGMEMPVSRTVYIPINRSLKNEQH